MNINDIKRIVHDKAACQSVADQLYFLIGVCNREAASANTETVRTELTDTARMLAEVLHDTCDCGAAVLKRQIEDMREPDRDYADGISPVERFAPIKAEVRKLNPKIWGDLAPNAGEGET